MWDLKLIAALYIYDEMMRGSIPVYWDESDRVAFDVKKGISKSRAAIERKQELEEKKKTKTYGEYFYVVPRVIDGGNLPTREEWAAERAAKQGRADSAPR